MKKTIFGLLILILLAGCSLLEQAPVNEDVDLSTRVAQILTDNPTSEVSVPFPVQTLAPEGELPTITPTATLDAMTATVAPTEDLATKTPLPTMTPLPSETPTETATLPPTAVPPESDPRLKLGTASSTDLFTAGNQWVWPIAKDEFSSNEIRDGFMVMRSEGTSSGWRLPAVQGGSNMYIEGTFRTDTCAGKDTYGIMFRVPIRSEADRGYFFGVSCDGQFKVWMWDGKISKATVLTSWTTSDTILTGSNQTNRLGVMTEGNKMGFYINGYLVGEANEGSFPGGYFGVYIDPTNTDNFTYYLEEMSYWIR
jgi:hypothetical protein